MVDFNLQFVNDVLDASGGAWGTASGNITVDYSNNSVSGTITLSPPKTRSGITVRYNFFNLQC